jgi:hypothetical protein
MARRSETKKDAGERNRLSPIKQKRELLPWRRADQLKRCFLYWLPVQAFPVPESQRRWTMVFLDRLSELLQKEKGLRSEQFLKFKSLLPDDALKKQFMATAREFHPLMGLSRVPGSKVSCPPPPTDGDLREIAEGRKKFDFNKHVGDYSYWFVDKAAQKQRELFFGRGAMTIIFLPPDPKTQAPPLPLSPAVRKNPVFQQFDVDRIHQQSFSMLDGFQEKSRQMFGEGLEHEPEFAGYRFILPLLAAQDFFGRPEEEVSQWFDLFGAYWNESPADKGMILALKEDFEESLIELLEQMKDEGLVYPEG